MSSSFYSNSLNMMSISMGTPSRTINHDVAADLDSTNAFEGPEKLLEVWFAPSPTSLPSSVKENGLKAVPAEKWVSMLDMVNCKILSVLNSENVDAYLLSESSMFVFPHKIILKTCGTTTLLLGLQRLLHIAALHAGFPFHNAESVEEIKAAATPYRVFYSRKNFLFPDKQHGPHRSWNQEVKYLDDMFEGGSAYMVGKMNGDHWYLYITSPQSSITPPRTPDEEDLLPDGFTRDQLARIPTVISGRFGGAGSEEVNDETLEILMTDLDPEHAKQWYLEHASAVAGEKGLADVYTPAKVNGKHEDFADVFGNGGRLDEDGATETQEELALQDSLTTEGHAYGTIVSNNCGLADVYPTSQYPDARIDAYLFTPCGFSANGVVPAPPASVNAEGNQDGKSRESPAAHYFTVHVTPEPQCSYASFETNVPSGQSGRTTGDIIEHVVGIFRPGRFSVTLFEAKDARKDRFDQDGSLVRTKKVACPVRGYKRIDHIVHDFEDYDLVFRFYERDDWTGSRTARVGEFCM
ncbi:S-adenosylmethionine decarboxylase proenzyme [Ceratocystis fimbriata CBS 114723]|uniref:S-adenosylmethionine decarboxylase proenzyme n=1 Tax=Ceratocystis fimbriata CBS 114723 TaxID=1035309 RepID=A0A2C5WYQ7_9PEZI|nr:S-adenosylmethionine decarboxylase proenzyme [Ceratocystis fimbriata CBS 114723]